MSVASVPFSAKLSLISFVNMALAVKRDMTFSANTHICFVSTHSLPHTLY